MPSISYQNRLLLLVYTYPFNWDIYFKIFYKYFISLYKNLRFIFAFIVDPWNFIGSSLWCCRSCDAVAAVMLSLLWCFLCCDAVFAVMLSLPWCCLYRDAVFAVMLSLLWCCLCCDGVFAVMLSLLWCCLCCDAVFVVTLSLLWCCLCCDAVFAVTLSLLWCCLSNIINILIGQQGTDKWPLNRCQHFLWMNVQLHY